MFTIAWVESLTEGIHYTNLLRGDFSVPEFLLSVIVWHIKNFSQFSIFFCENETKNEKKNKKTRIRKKKFNFFSLFLMNLLLVKKFSAYFAIFFDIELHNTSIEHKTQHRVDLFACLLLHFFFYISILVRQE